jgi:hypothetical protein
VTCASDSALESWLTYRRCCTIPTHSVAVVTVSNQVAATTRETACCCRRLGTAMTTISRACMVGKQTLISVDCARETLEQPTEARTGNQIMNQHQLPVSRRPFVPLSWDWCTRYGRQRRSTFVVLSVYRFPCGRYGNGLTTTCGSWSELRNLHLLRTGSSRSVLGHWSRLERLRAWKRGRMIGCESYPAYVQN